MRIMCDSGCMYTPEQAKELGLDVLNLQVTCNGNTYIEYVDIDGPGFLDEVRKGGIPTSSQPPIGITMDAFDSIEDGDEAIVLCMADGLSGTYQSTVSAAQSSDKADRITVINTRSLCGPERYLVNVALKMRDAGKTKGEIVKRLNEVMDTAESFLIPQDFEFLKRGGRMTPLAATIGGMLKIVPVLTQTPDGKRLEKFTIKKSFKGAVKEIVKHFKAKGVDESYMFVVTHAGAQHFADEAVEVIKKEYPNAKYEIYHLSPAFITQGGPDCCAIQRVKLFD